MRPVPTLCGALTLSLGALPGTSLHAATGLAAVSYEADGQCHCTGVLPADLAGRDVATPLGARSVAEVCEAIGPGPGLSLMGGRFDRTVYPDAQCGNGPFATGTELLDPSCAGTREPGSSDCRPVGPRWDLETAYAPTAAVTTAADERRSYRVPAGGPASRIVVDANATAPDVLAGTASVASRQTAPADGVEIDGHWYRPAPAGTVRTGGAAGSRIVLDGALWLRADDPAFRVRSLEPAPALAAAGSAPRASEPPRALPRAPQTESPEALRERQRELVTASRIRAAERRAAGLDDAAPEVSRAIDAGVPPVTDAALPVETDADAEADADLSRTSTDESLVPAVDVEAVEAVAEQSPASADDASAPLSALQLPIDARSSGSDFGYLQAMPLSYEIGGAGVMLEASAEFANRYHVLARAGLANKYQEALLGAGLHYTPPEADRLTLLLTGGFEYGVFPLERVETGFQVDDTSTGVFAIAGGRLVLNARFELEGGVGYSSFHEGDPHAFGGGFFHVNDAVSLSSRFELGDNDQFGIGVRVYY